MGIHEIFRQKVSAEIERKQAELQDFENLVMSEFEDSISRLADEIVKDLSISELQKAFTVTLVGLKYVSDEVVAEFKVDNVLKSYSLKMFSDKTSKYFKFANGIFESYFEYEHSIIQFKKVWGIIDNCFVIDISK